jgi:hypothetical protein
LIVTLAGAVTVGELTHPPITLFAPSVTAAVVFTSGTFFEIFNFVLGSAYIVND